MESKRKYFKCGCGHAVLEIDQWSDATHPQIYLGFFEIGLNKDNRYGWKERLRHAWYVIKTGRAFADSVVLEVSEAEALGKALLESTLSGDSK